MPVYPINLLKDLKAAWTDSKEHEHDKVPKLPSDKVLLELLEVTYHASFLTEESRKLGVRILFVEHDELKQQFDSPHSVDSKSLLKFDIKRPFSKSEILRLAPATDPEKMLIGVGHDSKAGLSIWGLVDIGSSWWKFIHGESSSGAPPPNKLTISSTSPGGLTISRGGRIIINLNGGKIDKPLTGLFYKGPIFDFFKSSHEEFYNELCKDLKIDKFDKDGHDDDYPIRRYTDYLERLIFNIRKLHHGGTLIIVPDKISNHDIRLRDRITIKYNTSFNKAWGLLKKDLSIHRKYYDKHFELWESKKQISVKDFKSDSILDNQMDDIKEAINDTVKFTASLSGIDGAVVISDKYRLLGFGGEVVVNSSNLQQVSVANDVEATTFSEIPIESFGTRHRSAFRFCSSFEDSIAIIVSQDGGVKAVKRCEQKLVLWPDINEGYFGI